MLFGLEKMVEKSSQLQRTRLFLQIYYISHFFSALRQLVVASRSILQGCELGISLSLALRLTVTNASTPEKDSLPGVHLSGEFTWIRIPHGLIYSSPRFFDLQSSWRVTQPLLRRSQLNEDKTNSLNHK